MGWACALRVLLPSSSPRALFGTLDELEVALSPACKPGACLQLSPGLLDEPAIGGGGGGGAASDFSSTCPGAVLDTCRGVASAPSSSAAPATRVVQSPVYTALAVCARLAMSIDSSLLGRASHSASVAHNAWASLLSAVCFPADRGGSLARRRDLARAFATARLIATSSEDRVVASLGCGGGSGCTRSTGCTSSLSL